MIKLTPPNADALTLFDKIVENKNLDRRERLNNIRNIIVERYDTYNDNLHTLENITVATSFTTTDEEDLRSCYGENVEFKKQVAIIQNMQSIAMQAVCPYCGIGEPETLDHYLPKGLFPEYSVFPSNLVPCCDPCNRKKGEKWLENGVRRIISFYNENIPTYKYLHVNLIFERSVSIPTINYSLIFDEESNLTKTICMHYRDLNLFERYEKQINDKVSGLYDEILEGATTLSIDEQKANLTRRINSLIKRFGINYWEAQLYEAAIESNFFEKCYDQVVVL
ncbi:hypothetical protein [Bacillus sp. UNCCL81]|uniref:HNH endonuclease n=1 Tax=Bacillus sp. UNCCL81 TaxID=1502755 RepID=UPI0008ECDAE5|nr:hypothetical protein [Bacillus sp. UNCCL81]SFC42066.1 hypothetical protein SAMN02799633_00749 [Bacillus sp. UNCCL81]